MTKLPLLIYGEKGSGKTAIAINKSLEYSSEGKKILYLAANRLAVREMQIEALKNFKQHKIYCMSYFDLINKALKPSENGIKRKIVLDMLRSPLILSEIQKTLPANVDLIIYDQFESVISEINALIEIAPDFVRWIAVMSYGNSSKKAVEKYVDELKIENAIKIDSNQMLNQTSIEIDSNYLSNEDIYNWVSTVSQNNSKPIGAYFSWPNTIILDTGLGGELNKIENKIANILTSLKCDYIITSRTRMLETKQFLVCRSNEAYGVKSLNRLLIYKDRQSTKFINTLDVSKKETDLKPVDMHVIKTSSIKELNRMRLFLNDSEITILEVNCEGDIDSWWIEFKHMHGGQQRVHPRELKKKG